MTNHTETFWSLPAIEVLRKLDSKEVGLQAKEAKNRLQKNGPNKISDKKHKLTVSIFFSQFQNWLVITLLIATVIAFFLGERLDATIIFSLVFLSVFLGFFQEFRAERALLMLKKYITHKARVKRDGQWQEIDSQKLVVGDIVELRIGDKVPADIRILTCDNFMTDEAILTGESTPVTKESGVVSKEHAQPQGQTNMTFMGTFVSAGIANGVVIATGNETFLGKTAKLLEKKAPQTDFQIQTRKFSEFLFRIILVMTFFVFASNAILGKGVLNSFLFALALTVGVTPELLPVITTVTLSQGALKMAKKKVVVKRLMSVEDFGNIDTLCADKTGTLTEGVFSLHDFQNLGGKNETEILLNALLCSSGFAGSRGLTSNPTDKALWRSEKSADAKEKLKNYKLLDINEFDFMRKRVGVIVKENNRSWMIVKGAPESILEVSTKTIVDKKRVKINFDNRQKILRMVKDFEESGYRVLAVAKKKTSHTKSSAQDEVNMIFQGFLLFSDPVKKTATESLNFFKKLGVNIKIISGDSPVIVNKVAKEVGLETNHLKVITGDMLASLNEKKLEEVAKKFNLFARVTPEQKYAIVASLNKKGHIVGFLGDGVNDAPALKAADVGIAVESGAEVAKEAADIILLKKDLTVLAEGIETGRKTFGNITKYIFNTISANWGNMFTVAFSSLFLRFIPLLPSQILLNNFISDIPLLTIATDNVDREFTVKPRRWSMRLIALFMAYFGFISSFFDFALILSLFFIWKVSPEVFRTAWFVESSLSEIIITFAIRTRLPFYQSIPSKWLIGSSLLSSAIVLGMPFLKPSKLLFDFTSLAPFIWFWIGSVLISYFAVAEVIKHFFFARFNSQI